MDKAVRVGVLGLRRGASLARLAQHAGMQLVAVCERDDRRREAANALGAAAYREVEAFLDHPMDAVILVNDISQHEPSLGGNVGREPWGLLLIGSQHPTAQTPSRKRKPSRGGAGNASSGCDAERSSLEH
jgi:hypothetical protein